MSSHVRTMWHLVSAPCQKPCYWAAEELFFLSHTNTHGWWWRYNNLSCLVCLYLDRFMEDGSSKDRSDDEGETWDTQVHSRMVYKLYKSHDGENASILFWNFKWLIISFKEKVGSSILSGGFETDNPAGQENHWKSSSIKNNLGFKPIYWGGSGIYISKLRCQNAAVGCKCWHVMQPWTISALSWCKKKNLLRESSLPCECMSTGMYGTQQKIPCEGGGGGGWQKLCIHNKVLSVWTRKLAGVCFALIKRGASMRKKEFSK